MSTQSIETQIIERAWQDAEFKAALLQDPKAAINEAFGLPLPPEVNLTVVEESACHRYLVLPPAPIPTLAELEIAETELALAAGGRTFNPCSFSVGMSNVRNGQRRRQRQAC